MKDAKVAIIGAGLAGLNAARVLKSAGISSEIFEASDRVGGRVTSDLIDGYICDRGFQVINPAYSELRETGLVNDLVIRALPKGVLIKNDEDQLLIGDPRRGLRYVAGALSTRSGSWSEKIRFIRYLWEKTEDVTFGAALHDCGLLFNEVLAPFLTGVFLHQPEDLSNRMARELIHWFIKGKPGLPVGGAKRLPELLAEGNFIHFNSRVEKYENGKVFTEAGIMQFDATIIAADPQSSAALLGYELPEMSRCTTWYHSCEAGLLDSRELRIPLHSRIVNSVVLSNTAPDYAPRNRQLVATTSLSAIDSHELESELSRLWSCDVKNWDLVAKYEIERALPVSRPGEELVKPIKVDERTYLAGDWRSIPAQQGALLTGRLAAKRVISDLQVR